MKQIQPQRNQQEDLKWIDRNNKNQKNLMDKKGEKKLNKLILTSNKTNYDNMNTTNVINKSKKMLTDTQLRVLSKGFKFIPITQSIGITNIITNTEYSLKKSTGYNQTSSNITNIKIH